MKSWRDIAMDCVTHANKVHAAKCRSPLSGMQIVAKRVRYGSKAPAGRYEERLRPASYFRPAHAQLNDGLAKRSGRPLPEPPDGCYRRNRSLDLRARLSQFSLKPRFAVNW